jgi:hypothetical protein
MSALLTVWWRKHEPIDGPYRPTRTHVLREAGSTRTLCGLRVPDDYYDIAWDTGIDDGPGSCKACYRKSRTRERLLNQQGASS